MTNRPKLFINQAGDTIVEVLLATAVISAVLGGAYAVSSKSLQSGRAAQERTEATKLIEGQLERLKAASKSAGFDAFRTSNYCLYLNGSTTDRAINSPPATYASQCEQGTAGRYKINITYTSRPVGAAPFGQFDIKATWDRVGGSTTEEVAIINYLL